MIEISYDRKTAYDFRYETICTQILSLHILKKILLIHDRFVSGSETYHLGIHPLGYPALDAFKGTSAYEQDILSVDMEEFLLRMLSATLWGNIDHTSLKKLEHGLLHSLSGHVAGN